MNNVKSRHKTIVEMINETDKVLISDLKKVFDVSEMTLRRDLDILAEKGMIKRVRGGATKVNKGSFEMPYEIRYETNYEAKDRISRKAASMIKDGETVVIDTGTTALAVAEKLKKKNNLTVLTSSLRVAWVLVDLPNIHLIVLGGIARVGEHSLIGDLSENVYDSLFPDTFIMGVGGVDVQKGFTEFNIDDASLKRKARAASQRTLVVADDTKIGKTAFAKVASLNEVDLLITNAPEDRSQIDQLKQNELTVVVT